MRIRKARDTDLDRLVLLWWEMHTTHYPYSRAYYKLAPKRKACAAAREYLGRMIGCDDVVFLVGVEKEEVVASLLAKVQERPPVFLPQKRVVLESVVVDKDHRGQGIYTKLQARLERIARGIGAQHIELNVDVLNSAVDMYEKNGYSRRHYKMVKEL